MAEKSTPKERIVLGILLVGLGLIAFAGVAAFPLRTETLSVPPDPPMAQILLAAAALALVVAVLTAARLLGMSAGLRLLGREAWSGLLAASAVTVPTAFALRAMSPRPFVFAAAAVLCVAGVVFSLWFAQRAESGDGPSGVFAAARRYLLPGRDGAIRSLREIRESLDSLPRSHATAATVLGAGAGAGSELLGIVGRNCLDAIKALESGRDPEGLPIEPRQVGVGLGNLVADARGDIGLLYTALDPEGVRLFSALLDDISATADGLKRGETVASSAARGIAYGSLALMLGVPLVLVAGGIFVTSPRAKTPQIAEKGAPAERGGATSDAPSAVELKGRLVYEALIGPEEPRLFVMDLDTGVETQLTLGPERDYAPEWSHDGQRIAFSRETSSSESTGEVSGDLFTMQSDGSGVAPVTNTPIAEWGSAWSLDDTELLTTLIEPGDLNSMEVAAVSVEGGSTRRRISSDTPSYDADWSPDGARVCYLTRSGSRTMVAVAQADGSGSEELSPYPGDYARPHWSPDGSRIAYLLGSPVDGAALIVIDVDGSDQEELTYGVNAFAWSPDGKSLLLARAGELTLIPASGGDELTVGASEHAPLSLSWYAEGR